MRLRVEPRPALCTIHVGAGALGALVRDVRAGAIDGAPVSRVVIVADRSVAGLYGTGLRRRLLRAGVPADLLTFAAGERSKTRDTKARLEDRLVRIPLERDGVIVGLGGGVTTDLAGFLAATWHRGVRLILAPTSLLAMLDASIGGKTAVDHPAGKNLIGAFHLPVAVYSDIATLATLPLRELRCGIAEAVKTGAIASAPLFGWIERHVTELLARRPRALAHIVEQTCRVKAEIVARDPTEAGRRALLNFGHTLGHALEAASGWRLHHGEAVSVGMVLECEVAVREGVMDPGEAVRLERLLARLGLPVDPPSGLSTASILRFLGRDKKVRRGAWRFALASRIGAHAGGGSWIVPVEAPSVSLALAGRSRPAGSRRTASVSRMVRHSIRG